MFVLIIIGVLGLTACSSSNVNSEAVDSEIVVETMAGSITKEDFYEELKGRYGKAVLQEMVTIEVLQDKYDVSEEAIDHEVQILKDELGDQFEMWLQHQNLGDEESFRKRVYLSLLQEEAKADGLNISEEEMKQKYDQLRTEISAQHILVEEEETALEVKQKLDDGTDFAELAKGYSIDSSNAEDGGELGYFSVGTMVPEFESAAYDLEVGETSEPVATQFGYHIIKLLDKQETNVDIEPFENMKGEIRQTLIDERIEVNEAQEKIAKLIEDANIDIKIEEFEELFNVDTIN